MAEDQAKFGELHTWLMVQKVSDKILLKQLARCLDPGDSAEVERLSNKGAVLLQKEIFEGSSLPRGQVLAIMTIWRLAALEMVLEDEPDDLAELIRSIERGDDANGS